MANKTRTNFLLNWYANPYHTPLFVAQALGYYENVGIKLALFEPTDPSDVTEAVGVGAMDLGLKAMIHTLAARAKGFPVVSLGTLLDEPPTGLLALKSSGIRTFQVSLEKESVMSVNSEKRSSMISPAWPESNLHLTKRCGSE